MSEFTKSGSPVYPRSITRCAWEAFAKELNSVGDELAEYSRNLERSNGGGETEQSQYAYTKSSFIAEVAKAAAKTAEKF